MNLNKNMSFLTLCTVEMSSLIFTTVCVLSKLSKMFDYKLCQVPPNMPSRCKPQLIKTKNCAGDDEYYIS